MMRTLHLSSVALLGGAVLAVAMGGISIPRSANATPQYAQQTGRACGACHVSKSGGGALTTFGRNFAANGHKLPSKSKSKGGSSSVAPAGEMTTNVTVSAPAREDNWVPGTNPGVVFTGPAPLPALRGGPPR